MEFQISDIPITAANLRQILFLNGFNFTRKRIKHSTKLHIIHFHHFRTIQK